MSIASELRGPGLLGPHAKLEYRALRQGQPLVLVREPMNQADGNAVIAKTALLQPVAYVAKEHAAMIATKMDRGEVWLAAVNAPANAFAKPQVSLFSLAQMPRRRKERIVLDYQEAGASYEVADRIVAGDYMMPDEGAVAGGEGL